MNINDINWNAISSLVTVIMTVLAGITLWVSCKQRRDDLRARLSFEVISWEHLFLLKVTNVGKEAAYNVHLNISGKPIEDNYSKNSRKAFDELKMRNIAMLPGRSLYFMLSDIYSNNTTHRIGDEQFSSKQVNEWLDSHIDKEIRIKGLYCGKYKINESFTMQDFIGCKSIIVSSPTELALMQLSKGVSCKNDFHRPIQEKIDDINKSLDRLAKAYEQK